MTPDAVAETLEKLNLVAIPEKTLRGLLNEVEELRARRDQLLAFNTAALEAKLSRRVRAFMTAINQEVRSRPSVPEEKVVRLRLRLIAEEFIELMAACVGTDETVVGRVEQAEELLMSAIADMTPAVDLPAVADALSDLRVVIVGSDAAFGINGDAIDNLVMTANELKLTGEDDEHGKRQKPPGWTPPDIAGELRRQGWES